MATKRGVAYIKPGVVEVQSIDFPKLEDPTSGKKIEHGVLLKIVSTNICGSDQHMVRGRTTAEAGLILGHEITGEVIECGRDVLFIKKGDIVSVRDRSRKVVRIQEALELAQRRGVPEWLEVSVETFTGTVKAFPARADLTMPINEKLVVELYSK